MWKYGKYSGQKIYNKYTLDGQIWQYIKQSLNDTSSFIDYMTIYKAVTKWYQFLHRLLYIIATHLVNLYTTPIEIDSSPEKIIAWSWYRPPSSQSLHNYCFIDWSLLITKYCTKNPYNRDKDDDVQHALPSGPISDKRDSLYSRSEEPVGARQLPAHSAG